MSLILSELQFTGAKIYLVYDTTIGVWCSKIIGISHHS